MSRLMDYVITLEVSAHKSKKELQKLWKENQHRFPLPIVIKTFTIQTKEDQISLLNASPEESK